MAQAIKYSASYVNNTIKKGNLSLGTESVGYGPSSSTGFYNTVNPPQGGYVTYNNNNGTLSYNIAKNDSELISYLSGRRGQTMTTIAEAISWAATEPLSISLSIDSSSPSHSCSICFPGACELLPGPFCLNHSL